MDIIGAIGEIGKWAPQLQMGFNSQFGPHPFDSDSPDTGEVAGLQEALGLCRELSQLKPEEVRDRLQQALSKTQEIPVEGV